MIKMIAGVFGLPVDGVVKRMDKDSDPFKASEEQEARLVKLGLAAYVGETPEQGDDLPDLPDGAVGIPEYSTENTVAELREIGKLFGMTFKVGMTKDAMVMALDEHIAAHTVEGVTIDENGEISVDDDAPTFDAAEAVE